MSVSDSSRLPRGEFDLSPRVRSAADSALARCAEPFRAIGRITRQNQQRVLAAFIRNRVSEACLNGTTGYGYGDRGRDTLERVCADVFGAEDALVRQSFLSGTHTLTVALFGLLRPGDTMLCVTGRPYDTLLGVLGFDRPCDGSLADFGVRYEQMELLPGGGVDLAELRERLRAKTYRVVYLQRSRGYALRPSLTVDAIGAVCDAVHRFSPGTAVLVDNCYGEFAQTAEPTMAGADLIAGSLIKNPGGGIAPCGGYIAGRANLVARCANRMSAPGVGREIGATPGGNRELYLGFYNAPHSTGEAMKTAVFASALFDILGFSVSPAPDETRADIIQCIFLKDPARLSAFCKGLQSGSPVDAFVTPEPWDMPGYDCKVIMAAGAFTGGSSIELSADAPLRAPYAVWMQGGLQFDSAMVGVLLAANEVLKLG